MEKISFKFQLKMVVLPQVSTMGQCGLENICPSLFYKILGYVTIKKLICSNCFSGI